MSAQPKQTVLYQNYPNPFNPLVEKTKIRFEIGTDIISANDIRLEKQSHISIKIYNIALELVKTFNLQYNTAIIDEIEWDGKNEDGEIVSDGIYLCQFVSPSYKKTIKIMLIKN